MTTFRSPQILLATMCLSTMVFITSLLSNTSDSEERSYLDFKSLIERAKEVSKNCERLREKEAIISRNKNFFNFIVDEKYSILFCYIPKVDCSNWKRIFILSRWENSYSAPEDIPKIVTHNRLFLKFLEDEPNEAKTYFLNTYQKVIFVRHPLYRILSAFRNKLEHSMYGFEKLRNFIHERFCSLEQKSPEFPRGQLPFSCFVRYLIAELSQNDTSKVNRHWQMYSELCQPCDVKFDIIGHYENQTERRTAMRLLHLYPDISIPSYQQPSTDDGVARQYYHTLDQQLYLDLVKVYRNDFEIFGYNPMDLIPENRERVMN